MIPVGKRNRKKAALTDLEYEVRPRKYFCLGTSIL
ncbi:rCG50688 [Rattus norvegicus]|uniref:RCG50688 n=1 Tax=Rattus norvegicus TaxID=10116 RepID=A6KCX4_RAT|nr:rCG50688 [Rattus norvegicus]